MNITVVINSLSKFIFEPVNVLTILLDFSMAGLPNFLHVCKFKIWRSHPESNWKFYISF